VDNAIRHSPEGGAIWITGHALDSDAIELSVTDEGPGIPEAFQDRIFDRYYQLEQGVTKKAGMGLGLFIVKRIAEMHGGEVMCESEPGEGATFRVTLRTCA
jgi:signal transduction histidine kinase